MIVSVIGLGRVGLPLALYLENKGVHVNGIDKNTEIIKQIKKKKMPFKEKGCNVLLNKSKIKFTDSYDDINHSNYIIITVGTPILNHFTSNYDQINECLENIVKNLKNNQVVILRSTIAPGTMNYVKKFIEQKTNLIVGKSIGLSFCPERLSENNALEELNHLPQIIGTEDKFSLKMTNRLFNKIKTKKIFNTNYVNSELTKLFNNVHRYVNFAISNQFTLLSDLYKGDIHEIIEMCNYRYPRGYIPLPGLTGGTCLRKDFILLNEKSYGSDLFTSAWKTNEYMTYFLCSKIDLAGFNQKKILILGASFKKNSDDLRDSLVEKIVYYCKLKLPKKIEIFEPNIKDLRIWGIKNIKKVNFNDYNIIIFATNHSVFKKFKNELKNKFIIDIWNVTNQNKISFRY
jgi:UDP-N-acetyl-D-mannosaminuronic acid dehydrogenase